MIQRKIPRETSKCNGFFYINFQNPHEKKNKQTNRTQFFTKHTIAQIFQ